MQPDDPMLQVRVKAMREEASGVLSFELQQAQGGLLPDFEPGAHIDVVLPGSRRSYSLCNASDNRKYIIAVAHAAASRGGSRHMHEAVRVGTTLCISAPRNHFPLAEHAGHSVFVAGGIGITPIVAMLQRLTACSRSWELHYSCARRDAAPFQEPIAQLARASGATVRWYFTQEGDSRVPLADIVRAAGASAHLYCCGPSAMLQAFGDATAALDSGRVHVEHFAAAEPAATEGGFLVTLAASGLAVRVPRGSTILETLLAHGIKVSNSCREGVCGMCETHVLRGVPDHRDQVLSRAEHAANKTMMICCSGSLSQELVLDL